ncbi:hypothetical protein R3P38DRAFT_2937837 [Favolaschia claudopus]|uniref:Uncharacterized protein n=1 Tax=Favolaschia claudopus TaxID=2862362 RepID=A0AAW0BQ38_9AGAR
MDPQAFFDSLPSHIPRPQGILQPAEARQKADPLRRELFDSWYRLKSIVLAHEEAIQKRWKKRTGIKRKQLLQEVSPSLPAEHAPEISALNEIPSGKPQSEYTLLDILYCAHFDFSSGFVQVKRMYWDSIETITCSAYLRYALIDSVKAGSDVLCGLG